MRYQTKRPWAQYTVQVTICKTEGCSNKITQSSGFRKQKNFCDECIRDKKRIYIKIYCAKKREAENGK